MVKNNEGPIYNLILINSFLITIAISPWVNKDSMIIPKLILIFLCALYLLPKILFTYSDIIKFKKLKVLLIISILTIIQSVFALILSAAPFEQQLFGRTGRGLGLITTISITIVMFSSAVFVTTNKLRLLLSSIVSSCLISSIYSLLQSFGIDFLKWDSRTNGVIGTLGNPNFQSSFAAMGLIPTAVYFWNRKYKLIGSPFFVLMLGLVIIRTQSTQGYIAAFLSIFVFIVIFYWYRNRKLSYLLFSIMISCGLLALLGMLNKGPLSYYLYKISVQSRGDFWRSAIDATNSHPFFGVGLDSFGESYLKYRDAIAANHPWAEYTDNAHNFFLQYAVTAGYPLAILQLTIIFLTLASFIQLLRTQEKFNASLTAFFAAWLVFQTQSIISPGNLPMIFWNAVISGSLIGVSVLKQPSAESIILSEKKVVSKTRVQSYCLVLVGLLVTFPLFNTDRLQMKAMNTGNGDLAIVSAKRYPESVLRYQVITRELLNSNLYPQALDVALAAVKFNPNSANLWALIVINPIAPINDRLDAKSKILKLDPLNKEVINYEVK